MSNDNDRGLTASAAIIPADSPVNFKSATVMGALSKIQQYFVMEKDGSEIPGEMLTIQGKLEFFNTGFGSGFIEGIIFALLTIIILPLYVDYQLRSFLISIFPLFKFDNFLLLINCTPVLLFLMICCFLSKYRVGNITKSAIDNLLVGRLFSMLSKAVILYVLMIFVARTMTLENCWSNASFLSGIYQGISNIFGYISDLISGTTTIRTYTDNIHLTNRLYTILWKIRPELIKQAYEVFFVFIIASIVPFITIWGRAIYLKIQKYRYERFWK
ncbi:MAG: hypothetical protein GY714_09085 [Desulfobacterales bacterium]|nr:hypothetical protein [Desulfobacterales bacterium]